MLTFRFRTTFLGFSVLETLVEAFIEESGFVFDDWEVFPFCIGEGLFGLRTFELGSVVGRTRRGLWRGEDL